MGAICRLLNARYLRLAVGCLEQAESIFHFEDRLHRSVDARDVDPALGARFREIFHEHRALQVHVDSRVDCLLARLLQVLRVAVRNHLVDRCVIGYDEALETPFIRSEEHTSELQSLMRISYAVSCMQKKKQTTT